MKKISRTSIILLTILIFTIIISLTAVSLVSNSNTQISEEEISEIVDEVIDEITTYIQIQDKMGKYYTINGTQKIQKIALLIKPLVTTKIDFSEFSIKISNSEDVQILKYNGSIDQIGRNFLFENSIWENIENGYFGLLVVTDKDQSMINYDILNDDTVYIMIKLPEKFTLEKGDTLSITLLPSSGLQKTITLTAPLPMKSIVIFD